MARTRKSIQPLNLIKYNVLIEDKGTRSEYFKISQFDGYFYGGRNAFLIAGAGVLRPNSKILVEILNSDGDTVYSVPVQSFVEGNSRLIQVEIYSDTPIGPGKIVILGCADTYIDGKPIPSEWSDKFNVRWISDVVISPLVENRTPIRFLRSPELIVEEKFYLAPSSSAFTQSAQEQVDLQISPKYFSVFPNGYLLKINGPDTSTRFFSDYLGGVVTGSIKYDGPNGAETASINLPITRIYNRSFAESEGSLIYTDKNNLILSGFISSSGQYSTAINKSNNVNLTSSLNIEYNQLQTFLTKEAISFAKIRLVNLNTISGEINKIRLSYKPATEPGEFVVLGDVRSNVSELLAVDSGSKIAEVGKFREIDIDTYWYSATMSLQKFPETDHPDSVPDYYLSSSLITTSNFLNQCCINLLDSVNANPPISSSNTTFENDVSYFIGTRASSSLQLFPQTEYTLSFEAFVSRTSGSITLNQSDYSMEVYLIPLSGSKVLGTDPRGQRLATITPSQTFQRQNFETLEYNFIPKTKEVGTFALRFIVYGGFWDIANVSIKPATEPFFSPDEFDTLIPNVNYRNKFVTFKAEYLDINNNSIGISTVSLPTYFVGSDAVSGSGGSYPFTIETDTFVGDAITNNFALSKPYDSTSIIVSVDGLTYTETIDYSISGTTLSFISAPPSQSNILVRAFLNVTENLTGSFSGSFLGNISNAVTASYAEFAENAFPYSGSALITGSLTVSGSGLDVTGTTAMQAILEKAQIQNTAATGTINYDIAKQVVLYYTLNSTNNWTLNFRGDSTTSLNTLMAVGQTLTLAFLVTNGSTGYYPTSHTIDGNVITPKWQGGAVPSSGNTNAVDIYTYTIIKTANATFTVFASQVMFL
jgi:hypothetical protein